MHLLWSSPRCWDIPDKHKSVHACDSSVAGEWCGCCVERVKNRTDERKTAELGFFALTSWWDHSVYWFMDSCSRPYRVCGKLFDKSLVQPTVKLIQLSIVLNMYSSISHTVIFINTHSNQIMCFIEYARFRNIDIICLTQSMVKVGPVCPCWHIL